jgi:hypothetical protein
MQIDYAAVAALPEQEQIRLLETGDGPERLWAAWALALRQGRGALSALASLPTGTLNEGLKRQLLVVIAGLGARTLLREIALADPSVKVRATALANYIRTCGPDDMASTLSFALEQVSTRIPELVISVLIEHEANRLKLPEPVLLACLSDQNPEIRQTAINCILSEVGVSSIARVALLRRLVDEQGESMRNQLLSYLPRADLPLLIDLLKDGPSDGIVLLLHHLERKFGTLTWEELKPLTAVSELSVVDTALRLVQLPLPDEAIPWLSAAYGEPNPNPGPERRYARWRIGYALRRTLSNDNVHLMTPSAIRAFGQDLAEELAYFEAASTEELEENDYLEEDAADAKRLSAILSAAIRSD